jgi:outer membrane protein TolC
MRKIILCVSVLTLAMLCSSVPAFVLSFKKPPHVSDEKEAERVAQPENVAEDTPADTEEEVDVSQPLTLEQCIEIARRKATNMKAAQLNLIQADMSVSDAAANYLPQITTSGNYQFSDDADFGWERENYGASVSARYVIWDHGQREGTLAKARAGRDAEYSRYAQTDQSLVYSVIRAYYDLLKAEKLIAVDEQSLEQSKKNVEKVEAFVGVGITIEADIATARVQQANDELTVINDRNNLELARANLAVAMGLTPGTPLNVVDAPDYEQYIQTGGVEAEDILIEDAISQAFANRPELAEAKANLATLEWALNLARLEMWPRITADCGYDLQLSDYLRERDALKNHKSWDVSARVSYPIFDGGRTRRTVKRADIALQKLNDSTAQLERSVALEIHQAYLSLERALKSLEISSVQVRDARMSLDVSQGKYEQQMIILLELLDAQARYAGSMTNQVKAFYDYKVAERTLEKAMGVLQ